MVEAADGASTRLVTRASHPRDNRTESGRQGGTLAGRGIPHAKFSGGVVSFSGATFSGSVILDNAQFRSDEVSFDNAQFPHGMVSFLNAEFSGGRVDFSHALDWSVPSILP